MLATIQESFKQREKQNAILKTLGLNKKVMQKNTFLEFLTIGFFAGLPFKLRDNKERSGMLRNVKER